MIVEATCRNCTFHFSGHWHDWKKNDGCPNCRSLNVKVTTDEDAFDHRDGEGEDLDA